MPYTLYIYNCDRCGYDIRRARDPLARLAEDLDMLRSRRLGNSEFFGRLGPSVFFERLAMRLLQRFPMQEYAALWLGADPLEYVRQLQDCLWELKVDPQRSEEFLSALLPLTRAFLLTVYDPQRGLIVQYQEYVEDGFIYPPSALADYQRLDPEAATATFTQASIRKRILDKLTPTLEAHGFKYETKKYKGIYFQRTVNGKKQEINGDIRGTNKPYYKYDDSPGLLETEGFSLALGLFGLRILAYPNWLNEDGGGVRLQLVQNFEWADWLAEDILNYGLPILDKASTPEGLDWLYNSPEAKDVFPGNIYNTRLPRHRGSIWAVKAALLTGDKTHFEDVVTHVLPMFNDEATKPNVPLAKVEEIIEQCRAQLNAPGNG